MERRYNIYSIISRYLQIFEDIFNSFRYFFGNHFSIFLNNFVLLRITDEGSVPEIAYVVPILFKIVYTS